jgi:hypothetical protein
MKMKDAFAERYQGLHLTNRNFGLDEDKCPSYTGIKFARPTKHHLKAGVSGVVV